MSQQRLRFALAVCVVAGLVFAPSVQGFDEPPINLGFTSFMDGGPPSGPGWYYSQYMQYWHDNRLKDGRGDNLAIPIFGQEGVVGLEDELYLDAWVGLSQFIYQSDQETFFGSKWGMNLIIPEVWLDLDTGSSDFLQENNFGIGDVWVGPYLQWDPVMGDKGPKYMQRVEFQLIFPTGEYDDHHELNAGSNMFSFDPYWAATYWMTPKWTASWRLHWLWNGKNHEPSQRLYHDAGYVQPGQAVHLNFASSYEVVEKKLRLGVNGYYMDQFTDTEVDGHDIPGSQEKVFAIGPGLLYSLSKDAHLFFNVYFETMAENRPEGERFNLRFVRHF